MTSYAFFFYMYSPYRTSVLKQIIFAMGFFCTICFYVDGVCHQSKFPKDFITNYSLPTLRSVLNFWEDTEINLMAYPKWKLGSTMSDFVWGPLRLVSNSIFNMLHLASVEFQNSWIVGWFLGSSMTF